MYTLMLVHPLSVCVGGRSSWRGGAGIIKLWRGASGTPLSAIRGFSRRVLIFLGSSACTVWFIFNRETGAGLGQRDPHLWLLTRAVDIESGKHSLRDVLLGTQPKQQMEVTCGDSKKKAMRSGFTRINPVYFPSIHYMRVSFNCIIIHFLSSDTFVSKSRN